MKVKVLSICVTGEVKIDDYNLNTGKYRLSFNIFHKSSKPLEIIVSRNTLKSIADSKHTELIEVIDKYVNSF